MSGHFDFLDEGEVEIVTHIIKHLLEMLHHESRGDQGSPYWAKWGNGNSPHELALDAINEKFGIEYDVEWKKWSEASESSGVKSVKIRRKEEKQCPTCGQETQR